MRLTNTHADNLTQLFNSDNRTGMYLYYYELTGNNQVLDQAIISSFSGFKGGVAECSNEIISKAHPDLYPTGGVIDFSKEIAQDLLRRITEDISRGGTGVFTEEQVYQFAQQVWTDKKMGHLFPGRLLHPFREGITEGSGIGLQCGIKLTNQYLQGNTVGHGRLIGEKRYGNSRTQFSDLNKYYWVHIKPHGKDISYAVSKTNGKIVFVETSKFGVTSPLTIPAQLGAIQGGLVSGLPLPKGPVLPHPKKSFPRVSAPHKGPDKNPATTFLKGFGLSEKDVSPKDQRLINDLAHKYAAQRPQFAREFPFQFFSDAFNALNMAAQASKNPKLQHVAQIGGSVVNLFKQMSALPGLLSSAPLSFAAFHPILGVATALFSLGSLLRRPKQGPNPFAQLMKQLQGISDQIAALHRDVIRGFNLLAEGQQKMFTTMIAQFHHMEDLIQRENERLGTALHNDIANLENFLTLIYSDLSYQMTQNYLQEFKNLNVLILDAISSDKSLERRRAQLTRLLAEKVVLFENWLTTESSSGMLNGHRYVLMLQEKRVQNAEVLINNRLIGEKTVQLECFTAYLGQIAVKLIGPDSFDSVNMHALINPAFWIVGVDTYVQLLDHLVALDLEHDAQTSTLNKVVQKGLDYLEFINILQSNVKTLFDNLLVLHRASFAVLLARGRDLFLQQQFVQIPLAEREDFKIALGYTYPEDLIKQSIHVSLHGSVLKFFSDYKDVVIRQKQETNTRYLARLEKIIDGFNNNKSLEEITSLFNSPLSSFARHRQQTVGGTSCLEVNLGGNFSDFEKEGFKIPFLLTSLFDHSPELATLVPPLCCVAEVLGLGHFEINAIATYMNNDGQFTDAQHLQLNGSNYKNYKFTFEIYFVNAQKNRVKLGEFDCQSDQLPMAEPIIQTTQLALLLKQRMNQVPPFPKTWTITQKKKHGTTVQLVGPITVYPPENLFLEGLSSKIAVMSQIPHLTRVSRVNAVSHENAAWVRECKASVEKKLNELKAAYYQFYKSPVNRSLMTSEYDGLNSSRNLILAFMHLCGFDDIAIREVSTLWSSATFHSHAERSVVHAHEGIDVNEFFNKDKEAQKTLQKYLETFVPSSDRKECPIADVVAAVDLVVEKDKEAHELLHKEFAASAPASESKGYLVTEVEVLLDLLEAMRIKKQDHFADAEELSLEDEMQSDSRPSPVSAPSSTGGQNSFLSGLFGNIFKAGATTKRAGEDAAAAPKRAKGDKEDK